MSRLEGEGSVFQIKTGRQAGQWRAELVVGYRTNGRKVTKTRTCRTKADAKAALRDLANVRDQAGIVNHGPAGDQWRFGPWLQHWLTAHAPTVEPATADVYGIQIRISISPALGTKRIDRVTAGDIRKVLAGMADRPSSARQAYIVMNAALELAVREKVLPRNPAADITPPTVKRKQIVPPSNDDVEAIYQKVKGAPDEARWLIALALGLRRGEALGLEWRDIDFEHQTLTVRQQLVRERGKHGCGTPKPIGPHAGYAWPCGHQWASKCPQGTAGGLKLKPKLKTGRGYRTIPLLPMMIPMLERIQRQQQRHAMMSTRYKLHRVKDGRRERDADLVFRTPLGGAREPRSDDRAWHEVLKQAGVGATRLHNARHFAAVSIIDSGVPLTYVADLLGHSDMAFTRNVYGHFSKDAAAASRNALQAHHAKLRSGKKKAEVARIRKA